MPGLGSKFDVAVAFVRSPVALAEAMQSFNGYLSFEIMYVCEGHYVDNMEAGAHGGLTLGADDPIDDGLDLQVCDVLEGCWVHVFRKLRVAGQVPSNWHTSRTMEWGGPRNSRRQSRTPSCQ